MKNHNSKVKDQTSSPRRRRGNNGDGKEGYSHTIDPPNMPKSPSFVTPSEQELLKRLGGLGLTNEEIAEVFGLSASEFNEILYSNSTLYDLLQEAKEVPNRKVEAALFRRALGYQIKEIHKVEGKPSKVVIKEIAPDVIADIFWLKNRLPRKWRDTLQVEHTLRDRMDRAHVAMRLGKDKVPALLTHNPAVQVGDEEGEA